MSADTGMDIVRKVPFSLIAEQSLLGSVLIDPQSFEEIAGEIVFSDFYLAEHQQIYLAMSELFNESSNIDVVTLVDMLVRKGIYEKSGGEDYIRTLGEVVPDSLNVKDYARIVKEKSVLRQLIDACGDILDTAYTEQDSVTDIIDNAENKIYAIAQGRDTKNFKHIKDVLHDIYLTLHTLNEDPESLKGTNTGFAKLDRYLAGMGNSDLVLIGARPGMGKTSFALNIAANVAKATGKTVCIFSLEMSSEQLVTRMISSEAMVGSYSLRTGKLTPEEWDSIAVAATALSKCNILIDDTSDIKVTGMKAKLRRVNNLGLVIIDYLQLMSSDRKIDNRVQEVGDISRGLKIMAKELNVPVICCAQLSRGPESRTDKRPMLSDLRDSGAIEQDADSVMFLYRDEYYKNDKNDGAADAGGNISEVIIAKNRHGQLGTVKVGWVGQYTKFVPLADDMDKD